MLSLWTSTIRWLAKHCISMVKLSMYTNRQLKKSQPSQLRQVDAVVDVTTVEAVVATITTKVDADVADAIKELTIDNFSKGEYIWKHIQTDLFRRVARSRNRRRNRRMPAGIELDTAFIQSELNRRKPGQSKITTPRKEDDEVQFLSGIYEGKTTGTPIGFVIWNKNQHSADYDNMKNVYRPSHADYTYQTKYGIRDPREVDVRLHVKRSPVA